MEKDELQTIDALVKAKEGKGKQSTIVTSTKVQIDGLETRESSVTISLLVHDDLDGEP